MIPSGSLRLHVSRQVDPPFQGVNGGAFHATPSYARPIQRMISGRFHVFP